MLSLQELESYNESQMKRYYSLPPSFNPEKRCLLQPEEFVEIGRVKDMQPFTDVLLGAVSYFNLPERITCPTAIASSLTQMRAYSNEFDQEATDVILHKDKRLLSLAKPITDGFYIKKELSYSPGAVPLVDWAPKIVNVHSHPNGRLLLQDIPPGGLNEDELRRRLDMPSSDDLATLLINAADGSTKHLSAMMLAGTKNSWLFARTKESIAKINQSYPYDEVTQLYKELRALMPIDFSEQFYAQALRNSLVFSGRYKIGVYRMPFIDNQPTGGWQLLRLSL